MEELPVDAAKFKAQGKGKSNWGEELRQKMEAKSDEEGGGGNVMIIFSLDKTMMGLSQVMSVLEKYGLGLSHIESRSSAARPGCLEFLATLERTDDNLQVSGALEQVQALVLSLKVVRGPAVHADWYPRTLEEMDQCLTRPLYSELEPSHPGASDPYYLAHRKKCWDIAQNYVIGTPIPQMEYSDKQVKTFAAIFSQLKDLYPTNACKEFNQVFPDLVKECMISESHIPQMEDISNFVRKRTGFTLRPVSSLLSARDFLSALAFRVFPATQYLRHSSSPFYTPEPDLCHELLGHSALLAHPEFAQFSQDIGLASLGAPDEFIEKLSSVYWYTIEFGICQEPTGRKAFGAGLLSSVAEIQYFLTDEPKVKPFDPEMAVKEAYPVEGFQTTYFLAESFSDALQKFRAFAVTIPRPFALRYCPYTRTINVLDTKGKLLEAAKQLNSELNQLMETLGKL